MTYPATPPPRPLLASELYALAEGTRCAGELECHWCSAPCGRLWPHDDLPALPWVRGSHNRLHARRPAALTVCAGCFLFRRRRATVTFLGGDFSDGKAPLDYSWWITRAGARAVRPQDAGALYRLLLKPPLQFCLGFAAPPSPNPIQLMAANDHPVVRADTPLAFTRGGAVYHYTVYELGEGVRFWKEGDPADGKEPGVRELLRILGAPPADLVEELHRDAPKERTVGRYPAPGGDGKITKKVVTKSGR